jgi:hypothetical protein
MQLVTADCFVPTSLRRAEQPARRLRQNRSKPVECWSGLDGMDEPSASPEETESLPLNSS